MNKKVIVLDGNHLAYRALYKFANLKTLDGVKTSVIYGMPYVAESLIRRLDSDEVVVVFDGGRSKFRMDLLPSYKQRDKKLGFDVEDFYEQKDRGRDILMAFGLKIVLRKGFEADDLIYMIARKYSMMGYDVTIVSGDKDFNQLILPNNPGFHGEVNIYNTSKGKYYTYDNLKELIGYTPEQTVDFLSLLGDKSDKIEGYPGIGPKKALDLLEKYGSVKNFLKSGDKYGKVDNEKLKEIWKLNKKLIDLKYFYRRFLRKDQIPYLNPNQKLDEKWLRSLCGQYEIGSFLKPQFLNTFLKLNK